MSDDTPCRESFARPTPPYHRRYEALRAVSLDGNGGRNHWGSVFSVTLAGGGVRGGQVYGSSDRIGAYRAEGRVRPEDLSATIFHCLGDSPGTEYHDPLGRPHPIRRGEVLHAIL